ncbi:MAG: hypothetical protein H6744_13625 [Deltaproteobacteria bacterium]|nr:hypothetical protein [Deltaproteobacteria bacterium]
MAKSVCCDKDADCDDGNACTVDGCDEATGKCANDPADGAACDDGDACTTSDTCAGTVCMGDAVTCDPSDEPCVESVCDSAVGGCVSVPMADGTPCDDEDECTENDACAGISGCVGTESPDCVSPKPVITIVEPEVVVAGVPVDQQFHVAAPSLDGGSVLSSQEITAKVTIVGDATGFTGGSDLIDGKVDEAKPDICVEAAKTCELGPAFLNDGGVVPFVTPLVACTDFTLQVAVTSDVWPDPTTESLDIQVTSYCPPDFEFKTFDLPAQPEDTPTTVRTGMTLKARSTTAVGPTTLKLDVPVGVRVLDAVMGGVDCAVEGGLLVCDLAEGVFDLVFDRLISGELIVVGQVPGTARITAEVIVEVGGELVETVADAVEYLFSFVPSADFLGGKATSTDADAATKVVTVEPGAKNVPVAQFQATGSATEELDLTGATFGLSGKPGLVSKLRLVADADGDGTASPDEPTLAEVTPTGPKVDLPIPKFHLAIGATQTMAVYADVAAAQLATALPPEPPRWPPATPWALALLALTCLATLARRAATAWKPLLATALLAAALSCDGGSSGTTDTANEVQLTLESLSAEGAVSGDPADLVTAPLTGPTLRVE